MGAIRIERKDFETYMDGNEVDMKWYLVDTLEQKRYGPYDSEEEYNDKLLELGVTDLGDWIPTWPQPEGAIS